MPKVKSSKVEEEKNGQVERKEEEEEKERSWSAVSGWLAVGVKKEKCKVHCNHSPLSSLHTT